MGNCIFCVKKLIRAKKQSKQENARQVSLCVLGIDKAGKSTFVKAISSGNITDILPTNGFSLVQFKYAGTDIIAYDLGGNEKIRAIWDNYIPEVYGVIYVVDGSNMSRIGEAGDLLRNLISNKHLNGKPLLILLNKMDQINFVDEIQFANQLGLHDLANIYRANIRIEVCNANRGSGKFMDSGMKDGFEWLLDKIFSNYDSLKNEVENALIALKKRQDEEKLKRSHNLVKDGDSKCSKDDEKIQKYSKSEHNDDKLHELIPSGFSRITENKKNKVARNKVTPVNDSNDTKGISHFNLISPDVFTCTSSNTGTFSATVSSPIKSQDRNEKIGRKNITVIIPIAKSWRKNRHASL